MEVPPGSIPLEALVASLPGPTFVLDAQRNILFRNKAGAAQARQILDTDVRAGDSMDQIARRGGEASMKDYVASHARAMKGETVQVVRELHYDSGLRRGWSVTYLPVKQDGVVTSVVVTMQDVELESGVRERMHLYERALAAVNMGVTICDALQEDLPLVYANPAFLALTGYTEAEVLGRNCRFLQGTERRQPGVQALRDGIRAERTVDATVLNHRKDGTPFHNHVTVIPVRDLRGTVTHFVGFQRDVTELVDSRSHLARAARLEASAALASGIAHDINNLLTVLVLEAPILAESRDAAAAEIGRDIQQVATSAQEVVKRLLEFTRGAPSATRALDACAFVRTEARLLQLAGGKAMRLALEVPDQPLHVAMAPTTLQQVLVNLVVNARHASCERGTVTLGVRRRTGAPGTEKVVISVTDNGVGMGPDILARVFEPFFTTREGTGGSGLGLTTSRRLVEDAGGTMEVESSVGSGSTFSVVLPLVQSVVPPS